MTETEIKNMLARTECLQLEADIAAQHAAEQMKLLEDSSRICRPLMERLERQLGKRMQS